MLCVGTDNDLIYFRPPESGNAAFSRWKPIRLGWLFSIHCILQLPTETCRRHAAHGCASCQMTTRPTIRFTTAIVPAQGSDTLNSWRSLISLESLLRSGYATVPWFSRSPAVSSLSVNNDGGPSMDLRIYRFRCPRVTEWTAGDNGRECTGRVHRTDRGAFEVKLGKFTAKPDDIVTPCGITIYQTFSSLRKLG